MARAIAREKRKETVSTEDQMAVRLLQLASWASQNSRAVIFGGLVIVAIGVGIWYFISYQRSVTQQAAVELETLRATATIGSMQEAKASLGTFIDRFGGTVYADEARLMLGRLLLTESDWQGAVDVLAGASSGQDTPLGFGAAMLLATAYEGLGDRTRTVQILSDAASGARYAYQRHQAMEEQARVLVDSGDFEGGLAVYDAILAEAEPGDLADRVRARRAEAQALGVAAAAGMASTSSSLPTVPASSGAGLPAGALPGAADAEPAATGDTAQVSGD